MKNTTKTHLIFTAFICSSFPTFIKKHLLKTAFSALLFAAYAPGVVAQFKGGITTGGDFYQRYVNPKADGDTTLRSSGCAVNSLYFGPKFWVGGENFSLSVEGQINWGILALDLQEYKGLGALAFPLLARLNFGGLSQFDSGERSGFSIGGGIQYSRTELYSLTKEFRGKTTRKLFRTYVVELALGGSADSNTWMFFVRYGKGKDKSLSLNIGYAMNFGFPND